MLPDCACSCVRAARIASFYWREKEKERVGGYEEEEEEEEEDNWLVGDPLSHRL
jgi:hypothetical protein